MIRAVAATPGMIEPAGFVDLLGRDGDIAVIGQATSVADAVALTAKARPDIVVLDLSIGWDRGREVIEQIMDRTPTPILVLSPGTSDRESPAVVEALVCGALDALPAPIIWTSEHGHQLREAVRRLSTVQVIRHLRSGLGRIPLRASGPREPVVAMAASTGGPAAFANLLAGLAGVTAPVLLVQHLHPEFTSGLFKWMSRASALPVEMAEHGQLARPGRVYIAPGNLHLRLSAGLRLHLNPEPPNLHRPSADVLLNSVAEQCGPSAIGVLLTGMGADGAQGLLAIRESGGQTLAQDEESSAVFGMPQAAWRLGAVTELRPLGELAAAVRQAVRLVTEKRS
jgi:two-component system chemotaxis response regulator CheB